MHRETLTRRHYKVKNAVREMLHNIEVETLSAIQLGGRGEWISSKDVMQLIEDTGGFSTYHLDYKALVVILRETKFPRWYRRRAVWRMV